MEAISKQERENGEIIAASEELQGLVLDLWQQTRLDWSFASDQLSNAFRAQKRLPAAARRAVAETLYSLIRNLRRVDFAIALGGHPGDRFRDRARLWATLICEFDLDIARAPEGLDWAAVKAVQSALASERDPVVRLGVAASIPDWLARALLAEYGDEAEALAMSLGTRAPMTVRANTLRTSRDELAASLAADGFETSACANAPAGLRFESRTNIFALPQFKKGLFEAQDEGSQLIAELVAPPPKSKVVDYCAGAGGKTLALAALLGNRGRVVAADISSAKLSELRRRARRGGVDNVATVELSDHPLAPTPKLLADWFAAADRVLVDAPCTGTGALRRNPESRWRTAESDLTRFPALQLEILERAREPVAVGGRLIYATCSLLRCENEDVVAEFLSRHGDFEVMEPKQIWGKERAKPVCDESERFLKVRPDRHGTDGFFAAVLRRMRR